MLVCWSILLQPGSHLLGHGDVDIWNHAWGAWWWWESLSGGDLPWRTQLLHWSDGGVLWFIDPVLAGLGAPLVPFFGPVAAVNLVLLAYVAFASWAIGRFAESLGAEENARWVASCAFAGSAWLICELHNGITEAANIGPVALALAWTEDAARSGEKKDWAKAGLGVGLASLASPYLGLGTAIAVLIRGLPHIRQAWLGAIVAGLVAAPPTLALRAQLQAEDAIIKHPGTMNEELSLHNAVDLRTFFEPLGFRSVDLSAEGFEHSMYLGWIALVLALLSLWRSRDPAEESTPASPNAPRLWMAGAVACLIMSLGPFLFWGGEWLTTDAGARYRLPWWSLQQLAPGLAITHPLRLAVPALAIVSALAALGASQRLQDARVLGVAVLVLLEGLAFSGAPWPIATADARAPAVYETIARESDTLEWGVLDLPTDAGPTMATSRYLFWQSSHRLPIPYGPDARASTNVLLDRPSFKALARLSNRRPDENKRLNLDSPGSGGTNPSQLMADGIRWIVVHRSLDSDAAEQTIEALENDLGKGQEIDGAVLWDLVP
jgi:hypothetical protein